MIKAGSIVFATSSDFLSWEIYTIIRELLQILLSLKRLTILCSRITIDVYSSKHKMESGYCIYLSFDRIYLVF